MASNCVFNALFSAFNALYDIIGGSFMGRPGENPFAASMQWETHVARAMILYNIFVGCLSSLRAAIQTGAKMRICGSRLTIYTV